MTTPTYAEPSFANQLHLNLARSRDWNVAPLWNLSHENLAALNQHVHAARSCVVETGQPGALSAPSPWHAAVFLSSLQNDLFRRGARYLFRGHADPSWTLTPSVYRANVDRNFEQMRLNWFVRLLASLSFNTMAGMNPLEGPSYFRIGPNSYKAAAQHYGIKTDFLDFTTDPDVAIKFATMGDPDKPAVIHILHSSIAIRNGLDIHLPPPFARRLFLQRGVLLQASGTLDQQSLHMLELRFPKAQSPSPFEVRREGGEIVDVLPEHHGMVEAINSADQLADGRLTIASQPQLDEFARTRIKPLFVDMTGNPRLFQAQYVEEFESMMYELVYVFAQDRLELEPSMLEAITRANLEIIGSVANVYRNNVHGIAREHFDEDKLTFMKWIAEILTDECKRLGYDHETEKATYFRNMLKLEIPVSK